ncbi:DUF1353 domain-containing protein [Hansschlegelia sp. KR7-227]|uniref:DUF1353 domain-containing protein n=1 Tax=Hansschlegelia sp. KR7-227 TaxID=3400914 RepID=UPI003C0809B6
MSWAVNETVCEARPPERRRGWQAHAKASVLGLVVALSAVATPRPAAAQFVGDLAFDPDGCMTKRECILRHPLRFIDAAKRIWQANAGDVTDGASIPEWAQRIIGGPWDLSYLKAAVLHDHYCTKKEFSWRETHLMFYEALINLGVNEYKAKLMYYSVYLGGPRWLDVVGPTCGEGTKTPCGDAKPPAMAKVGEIAREARYDRMDMHKEMADASAFMDANPGASLGQLRAMADKKHPDDPFLKQEGAIQAGEPADRFMRSMK